MITETVSFSRDEIKLRLQQEIETGSLDGTIYMEADADQLTDAVMTGINKWMHDFYSDLGDYVFGRDLGLLHHYVDKDLMQRLDS